MPDHSLAISTYAGCTIAVQAFGRLTVRENPNRRGQAEYLLPLINDTLHEAGISYSDLSRIGIIVGPGSFTGLRVGIATARAFGLALDIPVVGISAFQMFARAARASGKLLVALDTQRQDLFSIGYEDGRIWLPPMVRTPEVLQEIIVQTQPTVTGDALQMTSARAELPVTDEALATALSVLTAEADPAECPPDPFYLRSPDIGGVKAVA